MTDGGGLQRRELQHVNTGPSWLKFTPLGVTLAVTLYVSTTPNPGPPMASLSSSTSGNCSGSLCSHAFHEATTYTCRIPTIGADKKAPHRPKSVPKTNTKKSEVTGCIPTEWPRMRGESTCPSRMAWAIVTNVK